MLYLPPQLTEPDANDPLGFGLKSIAEPLQRLWLIRTGNPHFEATVREARPRFGIPESGFTNAEDYVNWVVEKRSRHGHSNWAEGLTRFHYRNVSWPIHESDLPGCCCLTDPLFEKADSLAVRFGIDLVDEEPGFKDPTGAVVEYILLNRWREARSLRSNSIIRGEITQTYHIIYGEEDQRIEAGRTRKKRGSYQESGLDANKGLGGKLPLWYEWWKLAEEGKTLDQIAGIPVETSKGPKDYELRMIRYGIAKVRDLMRPREILSDP